MIGIIISGHGKFASGLESGLEMVIGKNKNVKSLDFDGIDIQFYSQKLESLSQSMVDEYDLLAIVTDIRGGSPFNIAAKLGLNRDGILVFSGANFQLIYELLSLDPKSEDFVNLALDKARREIDYLDTSSL